MIRLYTVSDLHFTAGATISSVPATNDLLASRLLNTIYERHFRGQRDSYLLVTGDIVDSAREAQYRAAWDALAPFAGRLLACVGNHDVAQMGLICEPAGPARWKKYIQPICVATGDQAEHMPTETFLSDGAGTQVVLYGLNSTVYGTSLSFACGEIGELQLDALRSLLNRAAMMDLPSIVYCHHRPFALDFPVSTTMRLRDADALIEVVDGTVDVVAYGHTAGGLELPYGLPPNSATNLHGTQHLDGNASVREQSYFEIAVDGNDVRVTALRCALTSTAT
jgi:hypothetical protein